jgi:Domain of unknown function (DUF4852)
MTERLGFWAALSLLLLAGAGFAQNDGFDEEAVALAYHKISGEPLDFRMLAERSDAVSRASNFDRPDAVQAEMARLQSMAAAASPTREFTVSINDTISEYDHARGEFSINLFSPGHFVPIAAFRRQYQLVFANAESARAMPMPKDEARSFDTEMRGVYRRVVNEVRFRVVGKGDPAGAVSGAQVIRAEILSARLLDKEGRLIFAPKVAPAVAATPVDNVKAAFAIARADVAGFRVGVKAKDLEAALTRLIGAVRRGPASEASGRFAGALLVNDLACRSLPGRRPAQPGMVCVTALYDKDEVVRSIRIERIFSWLDGESFRRAVTQKYGPVANARNSGNAFLLGWGPEVELAGPGTARHALTANYHAIEDFMGLNRIPEIRVVLDLIDPVWAAGTK